MALPVAKQNPALKIDARENGRFDTLRYNICTHVVEQQYDRALQELQTFLNQDSEFPIFRQRVEKYVLHATDLVNAIRAKRNFPGAAYLTMAKQQELNDRFHEHFGELQAVLKRIEKVQLDLKLTDIRSTVLVLKSLSFSAAAIFLVAVFLEINHGLASTAWIVFDDGMNRLINWIFQFIG